MGAAGPPLLRLLSLPRACEVSEQSWCLESYAQLQPRWQEGHLCPDLPLPGPVFARYIGEVAGGPGGGGGGEGKREGTLAVQAITLLPLEMSNQ